MRRADRFRDPAPPGRAKSPAVAPLATKAGLVPPRRFNHQVQLPQPDVDFLRALVKTARQRAHHVRWVDRDGSARVTTLSPEDARRVNELAHQLSVSKEALLRLAAELPALGKAEKQPPA